MSVKWAPLDASLIASTLGSTVPVDDTVGSNANFYLHQITEGLKTIQDFTGRVNPLDRFAEVLASARGPLRLEKPLLDEIAIEHWNTTHARLFRRGKETWRQICEGLRGVAMRYATTKVVQKWVDPPSAEEEYDNNDEQINAL